MNPSHTNLPNLVSLGRATQRVALLLLAVYLAAAGGKFAGLVIYPLYWINVWLIALGGLGWLTWRVLRRRPFPATPLDLPLLAWVLVLLVSALASEDARVSLERWVYELVCVLVFYLLVDLRQAGKRLEAWVWLTLLGGLWMLSFGVAELSAWYTSWFVIGGWADPVPPATIRVQATMGHANVLAAYLNLLWPLAAVRLLAARSRWLKAGLGVYVLLALALIFFTSSRGGWLGSAAALGVLLALLALDQRELVARGWGWLRARKAALAGLVLAGLAAAGVLGLLLLRQVQHPSHPTGDPRGYIWRVAFDMLRESPVLGTGAGSYVAHFLETYSIPPGMLLPHAHNFLIHLLGENGLLGAACGALLGAAVLSLAIRAWRAARPGGRLVLAGSLAALAGLAVHCQFELPQVAPLVNLLTAALLAGLVPLEATEPRGLKARAGLFLLPVAWLAAACLGLLSIWGYAAYQRGLDATARADWAGAALWMDEAVRRDPHLALYTLQAGRAHGRLALDEAGSLSDRDQWSRAVEHMRDGLARQGSSAVDWARLGALLQAGGDLGAVSAFARAVELAPESVELLLALGEAQEQIGQVRGAQAVYQRLLAAYPDERKRAFWMESSLRREVLAETPAAASAPDDPWAALDRGEFARAEQLIRARLGVNDAKGYLGLWLALAGQGRDAEAERALQVAEFIGGADAVEQMLLIDQRWEDWKDGTPLLLFRRDSLPE